MTTSTNNKTIRPVWKVTSTGALLVTIPRDINIKEGDYVKIEKVEM